MFGNIGWGELVILLVAALVILGPDRLPGAISWVTKSIRQVKEYANGASQQLKDELGTDFEDLRKPLADLNQLRGMTPRAVITKHLLDGDDSIFTGNFDSKKSVNGSSAPSTKPTSANPTAGKPTAAKPTSPTPSLEKKLPYGQTPPIDSDAT
ncbi:Sec-independent protein translocase protein TatB [Rhodococcoides yunnanense]|uniref:Sec-independent protein translocase protein TatB n=1 Tax=Rhodococcoides yunnanense TaxID=278209 RepID=UPI000933F160|nr:Sec-independent protein translocase protein TatB [Rhodococcus yunnanensis]